MEKQIKMSLETAKAWYKLAISASDLAGGISPAINFLLENFTKEELEGKEGFTWGDCGDGCGYCINGNAQIETIPFSVKYIHNKKVFKTESQAKSSLAFAQLTHIVDKYNEGKHPLAKNGHTVVYTINGYNDGLLRLGSRTPYSSIQPAVSLVFFSPDDAEISMRVNEQLWKDYYMMQSVKATVVSS